MQHKAEMRADAETINVNRLEQCSAQSLYDGLYCAEEHACYFIRYKIGYITMIVLFFV